MLNWIPGRRRGPLDRVQDVADDVWEDVWAIAGDRGAQLFAAGTALGLVVARYTDPVAGRRRRARIRSRTARLFRRSGRKAGRFGRAGGAYAHGYPQKALHLREEPKEFDDVTLARKIESEAFRPADIPTGQINVNVQNGVAQLRGEVHRPELITQVESRVRRVNGVRDVENLLHVPHTAAPMHN